MGEAAKVVEVIGVRFRQAGRIYLFDPKNIEIQVGDHCIVETARGVEYGTVMYGRKPVDVSRMRSPIKPIIRKADERDDRRYEQNKEKSKEAFQTCIKKIRKHGLEMKLISAEYTFDCNKVLFYFTADGRVDFRELVKDLASVFRTRIELRQIGVRDETKIMGGIGVCGREMCCHSYLVDFAPVSIKMAKEQNLSLNPTKISGVCGRLMCCLNNEEATYEYLNDRMPNVGDIVTTPTGQRGQVTDANVLRQSVKVLIETEPDEKELLEFSVDDLKFKPRRKKDKDRKKKGKNQNQNRNQNRNQEAEDEKSIRELEELEKQEKQEGKSKLDD